MGYAPGQVARLRGAGGVEALDALWDPQRVLTVLGAPTVFDAIAEAQRRGLID